jgi:hypothetical protein
MMVEADMFCRVTMVTDGTFFVATQRSVLTVDSVAGGRSGGRAGGAGTKATVYDESYENLNLALVHNWGPLRF